MLILALVVFLHLYNSTFVTFICFTSFLILLAPETFHPYILLHFHLLDNLYKLKKNILFFS